MGDVRILIYKHGNLFVGQCLEHDICVQSEELDDIRRLMGNQIDFYSEHLENGLDDLQPAPPQFFEDWEKTNGNPRPIRLPKNMSGTAKVTELLAA